VGPKLAVNTSLWVQADSSDVLEPVGEPLRSHVDADVAIVGAGFTGLWSAYYLTKLDPSVRIVIVDAHYPGYGASGRNGGWVSALFPAHLSALARASSKDQARHMHTAMRENVSDIGLAIEEHGWNVDWAQGGTVVAARTPVQNRRAHTEVAELTKWGFDSDLVYLNRSETLDRINATDVLGGTFTPHCAAINPYKLVCALTGHLQSRGVKIYQNSPVTAIESGRIIGHQFSVNAPITIRATEGYTASLTGLERNLAPVYSMMLATEPLTPEIRSSIGLASRETFSDFRNLIIYGQITADNRIAFGGRGAPYHFGSRIEARNDHNASVHQGLWGVLTDMFPALHKTRVTHTWGGPLGIARDWWASCGFDPATGQAWSGGYVGDGLGTSHLGGKTLAHLITGAPSEITGLPWVNHRSRKWEPEPFRWLGANAGLQVMQRADSYEDRTGKESKTVQLVGKLLGH